MNQQVTPTTESENMMNGTESTTEPKQIEIPALKSRITIGGNCGKCGAPYLINVGTDAPGLNDIKPTCRCWNTGATEFSFVPSKKPSLEKLLPKRDTFSERLEAARVRRKLNKSELAERIGCCNQTIGHWESGKGLRTFHYMRSLSKALRVSADYLLGLKDEP